jgi:hypothetical protein
MPNAKIINLDPSDPSQELDETGTFEVEPLSVDAEPEAEAEEQLDAAIAEADPGDDDATLVRPRDVGELYGVHLTPAADRDLGAPEDHDSFARADDGENWIESLEQATAENGPDAEREIDPNDDTDYFAHHPTDTRDRPIADRGGGGRGGQ